MLLTLFRLAAMRRRSGASLLTSLHWAAGLLWRNHRTARRRRHIERRAQVEHAARQRL
ncbi:MAG: hypothetical protein QM740_17965 [Acidovorax sp.]